MLVLWLASYMLIFPCPIRHFCSRDSQYAAAEGADGEPLCLAGIEVLPNFISEDEEATLVAGMDTWPWRPSQSGRRKQVQGVGWGCVFFNK